MITKVKKKEVYPIWIDFSSRPLSRKDVRVRLSKRFSRKKDKTVEESVRNVFDERKRQNPMLYNASKFRASNARKCNHDKILEIDCSITDYRSYLGTNWNPTFAHYNREFLAEPLGCATILVTSCKKVVVLRRSKHVGEYPNCFDVPGGHAEPKNVKGCDGVAWTFSDDDEELEEDEDELRNRNIVNELFDSALCEIRDETNIPIKSISDLRLLGIVRHNRETACGSGPGLAFVARTSLNSNDIKTLYGKGPSEAFESTSLSFFDLEMVLQIEDTPLFKNQFNPKCLGAISLWTRYMRACSS